MIIYIYIYIVHIYIYIYIFKACIARTPAVEVNFPSFSSCQMQEWAREAKNTKCWPRYAQNPEPNLSSSKQTTIISFTAYTKSYPLPRAPDWDLSTFSPSPPLRLPLFTIASAPSDTKPEKRISFPKPKHEADSTLSRSTDPEPLNFQVSIM